LLVGQLEIHGGNTTGARMWSALSPKRGPKITATVLGAVILGSDTEDMATAARAFAAFSAAALVLYALVPSSDVGLYSAFGLGALGLTVLATAAHRPPNAAGWWALAVTILLFVCGDQAYDFSSRFPGPADWFYFPGYLTWLVAIVLLVRRERFVRDLGTAIDAGLVTLSVSTAIWCVFLDDRTPAATMLAHGLSWFYVAGDLVLLAIMIRVALLPGRRSRSFWWLVVAIAVMPVADASYIVPEIQSTWSYGYWADTLFLGSYAAIAVAALDPSMRSLTDADGDVADSVPTVRRFVALGGSIVAIPVAMLVADLWRGVVDVTVVAVVEIVVVVAVASRLALIAQQLHRARAAAVLSERRFRLVFERAPIGISVGRDGIMSETNPALQRMLGYTREEFAQMHYTEVTHPDDLDLAEQAELDAGTRDSFSADKQYVAKDGTVVDTHVRVALDVDDGLGISLIEDVRERRALEEQLRQAQKLEAVGKLAGGVAHDFNNLMTAVLGYSDLVLMRLAPGDVNREKIEAIREAALRAGELTHQLLAFGRQQVLQPADFDLRPLVLDVEDLLRRTLGSEVRVESTVGDAPVVVRADRARLSQVVLDLAANACEAMPGGGTLRLGVAVAPPWAVLTVADTGVGMDAATSARIFEPFFTTKAVGQGSGLGLATVHGIVGQSGGTIDVATAPGAGTVFTVRLPLVGAACLPERRREATLLTD
jgi:PAS domain S-box-containing protein